MDIAPEDHALSQYIRKTAWWTFVLSVFRGFLMASPIIPIGFFLLSILDRWLAPVLWVRQSLWFILIIIFAGIFLRGFMPFRIFKLSTRSFNLSLRLSDRASHLNRVLMPIRSDELRIVRDLLQTPVSFGISDALKESYIKDLNSRLENIPARWVYPKWPWMKRLAICVCFFLVPSVLFGAFPQIFPITPRVYFPFGGRGWENAVEITPGNASVPFGADAEVRVRLKNPSLEKPSLFVKSGCEWNEVLAFIENNREKSFRLTRIINPISYRVQFKKEWSPVYQIVPVHPIKVSEFNIRLQPPSYTKQLEETQNHPEIAAVPGTDVVLQAKANKDFDRVYMRFADGSKIIGKNTGKQEFSVSFMVDQDRLYEFDFILKGHTDILKGGDQYPIRALLDQSPTIVLLSPDEDLVIGYREKLPLTFDVADDIGLKSIQLQWTTNGNDLKSETIKNYSDNVTTDLSTVDWVLQQNGFNPGDVIQYRLTVKDGNVVTGPGKAETPWRTIQIASFEDDHEAVDQALEQWRNRAVDLLAELNVLKSKAEKSDLRLEELVSEAFNSSQLSKGLEEALKNIVGRMEDDPMTDYATWLEHKAIEENLSQLNETTMREMNSSLQTKNRDGAVRNMEKAAAELERMISLSEEMSKVQSARDIKNAGDDLQSLSEDLLDQLSKQSSHDPEMKKQIQNILDHAQELLRKMAKTLQQMPQELPEDFVNQPALKEMDLGRSQDLLSQIQQAINEGNMEKALSLAQQFLSAAQAMQQQLAEAHEGYLDSQSADKLAEEMAEKTKDLENLMKEQMEIIADTQKLDAKRLESMVGGQEELLKELEKRQGQVVSESEKLMQDSSLHAFYLQALQRNNPLMRAVWNEFQLLQLTQSPQMLEQIIVELIRSVDELSSDPNGIPPAAYKSILSEEKEIYEKIKKPENTQPKYSDSEKKKFQELSNKQNEISGKTTKLKSDLQKLSRKTASLGMGLTQSLDDAAEEMEGANKQLKDNRSGQALEKEEAALKKLGEGLMRLSEAQGAMSGAMQQQRGQGSGGGGIRAIKRSASGGGRAGSQTGRVKLPKATDYRPPKEFREELLKSLKEKYPKVYEDVIHEYYKRLTQ